MARIETDPNYTAPTFSRATAGTDLFKKEDVQQLAAATSTHTHGSGSGLPVAALAANVAAPAGVVLAGDLAVTGGLTVSAGLTLPANSIQPGWLAPSSVSSSNIIDNSITAADILDGTITAAELATNAITQGVGSQALGTFGGNAGSTTSSTFVDVTPPSSITITTRGGYGVLLVVTGSVVLSSAAAIATLGLKVDGAAPALVKRIAPLIANNITPFTLAAMYGSSGGSHTFQLSWMVSAGTVSMDGSSSMVMYAIEFLR